MFLTNPTLETVAVGHFLRQAFDLSFLNVSVCLDIFNCSITEIIQK